MNHIIETMYITGALVAICAAYPQLRQLIKTKRSDEFSAPTWATWLVTQTVTLMYVASLGNKLMIVVNIAWISFYFAMTVLIIYYQPRRRSRRKTDLELQPEFQTVDD